MQSRNAKEWSGLLSFSNTGFRELQKVNEQLVTGGTQWGKKQAQGQCGGKARPKSCGNLAEQVREDMRSLLQLVVKVNLPEFCSHDHGDTAAALTLKPDYRWLFRHPS